jgi:hypothetical protein
MLGDTAYEQWVRRLRDWGKDPNTSLDDLPPLFSDDRVTRDVVDRLVAHILKAQDAFLKQFKARLDAAFEETDAQAFARAYHNLQYFYARRLNLARHPGLSADLQQALEQSAVTDLHETQRQVEEGAGRDRGRGSIAGNNDMVAIVRKNSLLQILQAYNQPPTSSAAVIPGAAVSGIKSQTNLIPVYDPNQD